MRPRGRARSVLRPLFVFLTLLIGSVAPFASLPSCVEAAPCCPVDSAGHPPDCCTDPDSGCRVSSAPLPVREQAKLAPAIDVPIAIIDEPPVTPASVVATIESEPILGLAEGLVPRAYAIGPPLRAPPCLHEPTLVVS